MADAAAASEPRGDCDQAATMFARMLLAKACPEFLTLPLYEAMA